MKKLIVLLLLLTIIFAGCTSKPNTLPQGCTEEAKICPDGSAVGRAGPNCEFSPCPIVNVATVPPETQVSPGSTTPQACTMEAKLCPDGSAVGRSGPNCEFAACPGEGTSTCSCPGGYRQEGQSCNPECYYSTPKCLMPSIQCQ